MIHRSAHQHVDIPEVPLWKVVMERFAGFGERPALIDAPSGRTLTYVQLLRDVERAAKGLAAAGFRKEPLLKSEWVDSGFLS